MNLLREVAYQRQHNEGLSKQLVMFLISNFRRVLNVVLFLLGVSQASEFYLSTFRNTLSVSSL
jgi:hypothetical protein